jgi:hypothetical protein
MHAIGAHVYQLHVGIHDAFEPCDVVVMMIIEEVQSFNIQ